MANPHEGDVSFEALGNEYTLRLTSRAVAKIEAGFNTGIGEVLEEIGNGSVRATAAFLNHCIVQRIANDFGFDIIDDIGVPALNEPISEAIKLSKVFKGAVDDIGDDANEGKPKATAE